MATVIATENLSKSYKRKRALEQFALNDLNLTVEEGEIYGFLGPNGAGKTTTIKLLLGFMFPDKGRVSIFGNSSDLVSVRQQIGFLPEIAYYYKFLKAGELLNAYAKLFHISSDTRRKKIRTLMEKVGLAGQENTFLREFSKGMLQRLSLAQALLNDPKLLILDEPTSGLDPIGRKEVREIILELHKQGVTIFFSSHELSAVELISQRVGILDKGKLVREGKLSDLLSPTQKVKILLTRLLNTNEQSTFLQKIKSQLSSLNSTISIATDDDQSVILLENREFLYPVLRFLENEKLEIESILPVRETLEDLFMKTIKA